MAEIEVHNDGEGKRVMVSYRNDPSKAWKDLLTLTATEALIFSRILVERVSFCREGEQVKRINPKVFKLHAKGGV